VTPKTKRNASITGAVLFAIAVVGFTAGAAKGMFDAGAGVAEIRSDFADHGRRLDGLDATMKEKKGDPMADTAQDFSGVRRRPDTMAGTIAPHPARRRGWSTMTKQQQDNLALLTSSVSLLVVVVTFVIFVFTTGSKVERLYNRLELTEFFVGKLAEKAGIAMPPARSER
jgi:hypothetical protein